MTDEEKQEVEKEARKTVTCPECGTVNKWGYICRNKECPDRTAIVRLPRK